MSGQAKQGVSVESCSLNENDFAWSTMTNLFSWLDDECNPGRPKGQEAAFRILMARPESYGVVNAFANPIRVVRADSPTKIFVAEARLAQVMWFRQFRDMLHSSGMVKRQLKTMSPIVRQLTHTGVLVVNGKHVFPNQWPQIAERRDLTGQRFGRLLVVKGLPHMRCLCQCDCGTTKEIRRQHLVSGKTRSCGCLRREFERKQRERRHR